MTTATAVAPNYNYTIEEMEGNHEPQGLKKYLLVVNDKPYQVSELFYLILNGLTQQKSLYEITDILNQWARQRHIFTLQEVENIIEHKLRPMGVFDAPTESKPTNIPMEEVRWRRQIVDFKQLRPLLLLFQHLFHPVVFVPLFVLLALGNYYYMQELLQMSKYIVAYNAAVQDCTRGLRDVLLFYPILLGMLLFHELGHAAASYRFGVPPKNIGFGMYLAFPVLFADVTGIWKLNKWKRVTVNLGGVYFQLLINSVLIYWIYNSGGDLAVISNLRYLLQINVSIIIINLLPFIKFDGYWIYSDLFDLPNLRRQSIALFYKSVHSVFPKIPYSIPAGFQKIFNPKNPALILYTISRYIFLGFFIKYGFEVFFQAIGKLPGLATAIYQDFSLCTAEPIFQALLTIVLFSYFSKQYAMGARHSIKQFRSSLSA